TAAAIVGSSVVLVPRSPRSFAVPLIVVGLMLYSYGGVVFNITQISLRQAITPDRLQGRMNAVMRFVLWGAIPLGALLGGVLATTIDLRATRSEEHTSELQSRGHLVCRLLLEKKKK